MKAAILAIATFALAGCVTSEDAPDPYGMRRGNGGLGTICIQWIQEQGSRVETDSTATCKDGSKPRPYYAQWLSDDRSCPVDAQSVKGGIAGVRRVWGCGK